MTDIAMSMAQEQIKELRANNARLQRRVATLVELRKFDCAENERLQRRVHTLEGMLGEMNVAVPE